MGNNEKPLECYVNMTEGISRVMNNKALYVKLLKKFVAEPHLDKLMQAVGQNDFKAAELTAHTIKGLAANLSFPELYTVMQELEAELKSGKTEGFDLETAKDCIEKTTGYVNEIIAAN